MGPYARTNPYRGEWQPTGASSTLSGGQQKLQVHPPVHHFGVSAHLWYTPRYTRGTPLVHRRGRGQTVAEEPILSALMQVFGVHRA
jgi:hypothetical protein